LRESKSRLNLRFDLKLYIGLFLIPSNRLQRNLVTDVGGQQRGVQCDLDLALLV